MGAHLLVAASVTDLACQLSYQVGRGPGRRERQALRGGVSVAVLLGSAAAAAAAAGQSTIRGSAPDIRRETQPAALAANHCISRRGRVSSDRTADVRPG